MNEVPVVQYFDYKDIDEFLKAISYGGTLNRLFTNGDMAFRGHASDQYQLIPAALRPESRERFNRIALSGDSGNKDDLEYFQILKEYHILRDFYKRCDKKGLLIENVKRIRNTILDRLDVGTMITPEEWLPEDLWGLAALAQHYGVPTRFLDWTHDLYVALFFAVEDYLEEKKLPDGTEHIVLWALNLQPITEPNVMNLPLKFVQPIYHGNDNLTAQQGMFTLWQVQKKVGFNEGHIAIDTETQVNRKPLDQLILNLRVQQKEIKKPYLYRIMLPKDSAKQIYRFIKSIGYDASRIYPGYSGTAKSLMHDYFINSEVIKNTPAIMIARD